MNRLLLTLAASVVLLVGCGSTSTGLAVLEAVEPVECRESAVVHTDNDGSWQLAEAAPEEWAGLFPLEGELSVGSLRVDATFTADNDDRSVRMVPVDEPMPSVCTVW